MTRKTTCTKTSKSSILENTLIGSQYLTIKKLGGGAFGEVFLGKGPLNQKVAIKVERSNASQLRHEYKVYRHISPSGPGFCKSHYFGSHEESYVLVMSLVGPSLEAVFNRCNRKFTLKTVLQLADQILQRLDELHSKKIIHRDIKPDNFAMGLDHESSIVYCLDFGLASLYREKDSDKHYEPAIGTKFRGTVRYASINGHLGVRQSRRDDLESLGYMLIYFLRGSLPWQSLGISDEKAKRRRVVELKRKTSVDDLCAGLPWQFVTYMAYVRTLCYDADPDMAYLRKLFTDLYAGRSYGNLSKTGGMTWDWSEPKGTGLQDKDRNRALLPSTPPQRKHIPVLLQPTPLRNPTTRCTAKVAQKMVASLSLVPAQRCPVDEDQNREPLQWQAKRAFFPVNAERASCLKRQRTEEPVNEGLGVGLGVGVEEVVLKTPEHERKPCVVIDLRT